MNRKDVGLTREKLYKLYYEDKNTMVDIGKMFGCSIKLVSKRMADYGFKKRSLRDRPYLKQKEWKNKRKQKYVNNNKDKIYAQRIAYHRHKKPQICSIKGCCNLGIDRHHKDYSKPEEIIWLCRKHHLKIHGKIRGICSIDGCDKEHSARGFCKNHYELKRIKGDFL